MHSITHDKRFYNEEKHFRTTLLCRLFLTAQSVLSDICVQQGVAYQSREGRIGLLSKADRYLKFLDAEKFNLRFSDASEITEIADKLRWYRYQKGLRQRDAADYAGIDRSTYIHYEEAGRDFYPKEYMEKLAELFEVPLEDLLDDYNLFLLRGQGAQIKAIRQRLGLTQKAYAAQLGVPLQKFKRWEQGTVQIFKSTWEKYFKKM